MDLPAGGQKKDVSDRDGFIVAGYPIISNAGSKIVFAGFAALHADPGNPAMDRPPARRVSRDERDLVRRGFNAAGCRHWPSAFLLFFVASRC